MRAKYPVWPLQKKEKIELRLFSISTDGHTDSKQTAHTNEELSSQLHPSSNCGVITIFGWRQILGCCWRFVIGAEWWQTGFSREEDLAHPVPANAVAFWQVWVGFTSRTCHLAWRPVSHNNTDTLQSWRLESGGPLCRRMPLGSRTVAASFVFWSLHHYTSPCLPHLNSDWRKFH